MSDINSINSASSSLYFASLSNAAQEKAKEANQNKKISQTGKKISFAERVKQNQLEQEFVAAGLPAEIAKMSTEDAVIFLKDKMDEAADKLSNEFTPNAFSSYRLAVNQFMKYIVKNNFEVKKDKIEEGRYRRFLRNRKTGKKLQPRVQIQVINQKLDMLATDMLVLHADKLKLLARVNEIQGLIIDLLAD